jgi:HD-GYP domain-containing protein (c-di-GMP phosphodiesterase class II)/CHASE2 domain-containing sensor protein
MMTVPATLKACAKSLETRSIWIFLFGFSIAIVFSALSLVEPKFLLHINNRIFDSMLSSSMHTNVSKIPVIVDIDEKSLSQYGQWPWPRYRIARLLDKIRDAGPASIMIDIFFAEQDRTSPVTLQKNLQRDLDVNIQFGNVPRRILDNDKILAASLSQGPFVMGYKFLFNDQKRQTGLDCELHPLKAAIIKQSAEKGNNTPNPYEASGVICSLPELVKAVANSGFINASPDNDGILRRVPLVIEYKSRYYPSLALAVIMKAGNIESVAFKTSSHGLESVIVDNNSIPVDSLGNLLIKFPQGNSFTRISAADILAGDMDKDRLKDSIVIVGVRASGLGDFYSVPGGELFPGTEIHASIIDNIIRRDYLIRPGWMRGFEAILALALGIILTLLIARSGAWRGFFFLCALSLCILFSSLWALRGHGIFIAPLMPISVMAGVLLLLTLFKYWIKEHEIKESVKQTLLTQDFTILCLSSLIETRDRETGSHTIRCQKYIRALCRKLMTNPKFSSYLDDSRIEQLIKSAPLHDVGKIGVPDAVLQKPSKLSLNEYEEIKKHTERGYYAIERAERLFGKGLDTSFLSAAKDMAISHHERWDGKGYPDGLFGDNIPFAGRIMAIADVYDALISTRAYKLPYPHEEAVKIIAENRGKYFDPDMVDAFMEINEEFRSIAEQLPDDYDEHNTVYEEIS